MITLCDTKQALHPPAANKLQDELLRTAATAVWCAEKDKKSVGVHEWVQSGLQELGGSKTLLRV